jgi:peptidoglycan/xylan/chitin deacetylase (PgdA/CDA1 family)
MRPGWMPEERSRTFIMLSGASGTGPCNVTDVIVLCYHAVSPTWDAALSTTPQRFESQIATLLKRGYRGATFTEAVSAPPGDRVLAVTFDDAYRSVNALARPILDRHGLTATVFAPTDQIDAEGPLRWPGIDRWIGGPHESELTPMSWAELRSLADHGWEIGSHTGSHPHLTQVDDATLQSELVRSKAACERELQLPCTSLAYPYGDVDDRVVAAAARSGYAAAAALPGRLHADEPLRWPRIGVYWADDDRRFRLKVSRPLRQLRRMAVWDALQALRRFGRPAQSR